MLKKVDIGLLILFPAIATLIVILLKLNYLQSILVFFVPTAIWFSFRNHKLIPRIAIFSVLFTIPIAIIVNYIAVASGAWYVPSTVFPVRYLGILPFEDVVLGFLLTYSVIVCFEHFLDKGKHNLVDHKMKYFIVFVAIAIATFFVLFLVNPEMLELRNSYVWLGLIFVALPILTAHSTFPRLVSKYIKVGLYFSMVLLMFEYVGVSLNHWVFTGEDFFGSISILGQRIPYEEFFFWILLGGTAIISYYEFFDDGLIEKKS